MSAGELMADGADLFRAGNYIKGNVVGRPAVRKTVDLKKVRLISNSG